MTKLLTFAVMALSGCAASPEDAVQLPAPVPIAEWASEVDTLPGTYTQVGIAAELHDSLLIFPDMKERLVWRINLRDMTRSPFGSQGGGPGEYGRPGRIVKVHSDSVAILQGFPTTAFPVIDAVTGRGRTQRLLQNQGEGTDAILLSVTLPFLREADTLGHVYGAPMSAAPVIDPATGRVSIPSSMIDTAPVVRFSLRRSGVDTLLRYATGYPVTVSDGNSNRARTRTMSLGVYGPSGAWHVTPGGDIIAVDGASYTVRHWRWEQLAVRSASASTDERQRTNGAGAEPQTFTVPWTPVAVSDTGWDAHVEKTTRGSVALLEKSASDIAGQMGTTLKRPDAPNFLVPDKPRFLPPVRDGGGIHSAGDVAWIPVHHTEPPTRWYYDLIALDRGERLLTVALPSNQTLLHVSRLGAYVIERDEDDLQQILLYRRRAN